MGTLDGGLARGRIVQAFKVASQERRIDRSCSHSVHTNASGSIIHGHLSYELKEGAFGRAIGRLFRQTDYTGNGTGGDDRTAAAGKHRRQRTLRHQEEGLGVRIHHAVPFVLARVMRGLRDDEPGVAHKDKRTLMIASIRYLDRFVKQNGAWLFAERKLMVDWKETRGSVP
jgi:hypothetical protein